ncbi:MAG: hypothetical protein B6I37_05110 [Desulfobacteraceae bacterium 4572_35.2]|nr:MAG: hypothetical protein B6I37_05110 [Desulfobacteraceae bacterium 4572_35.2]
MKFFLSVVGVADVASSRAGLAHYGVVADVKWFGDRLFGDQFELLNVSTTVGRCDNHQQRI